MKSLLLLLLFPAFSSAADFECTFFDEKGDVLKVARTAAEDSVSATYQIAEGELIVFNDLFYLRDTFGFKEAVAGKLPRVAHLSCK